MGKVVESAKYGLDLALPVFKYFFKTEYLHYGYWPPELAVEPGNLARAQENYTRFLFSHLPQGVKRILDVGCGSGRMALDLIERGCQVDCVSPPSYLSSCAEKLLGGRGRFIRAAFEEAEIRELYDLVLFSESFQYVELQAALAKSVACLSDGGYLLICDFFRTDAPGKSPIGGGRKWARFEALWPSFPLERLKDLDITAQVAPTMDLVNEVMMEVVQPIFNQVLERLANDRRFLIRLGLKAALWRYRKKLEKLRWKHFSNQRTGENFRKYKTYRLLLFRKRRAAV